MSKSYSINKTNAWSYVFAAILICSGGIRMFMRYFINWNPVLYCLSVAVLALGCGVLIYMNAFLTEKKKPVIKALIAFAGFLVLAFALTFLINNVILGARKAALAAAIMCCLYAVFFIVLLIVTFLRATDKKPIAALGIILSAVMIVPLVVFAVSDTLPERYDHPYENKITETKGLDNVSKKNRLIINADDSHWWRFWNDLAKEGRFDDESLNEYVMNYADSGVTDLLFNIFCQSSDVPTNVMTFRGDLYGQTEQHGNPVDYSNYSGLNAFYNEQKIDIFAKWIEKCKEVNIRPWLTLRMNDCHDPDPDTSQLRGELFYIAEANGWTIGEEYGYYRHCVDYAVPEIRHLMLDYTKEQLLHYDVYGLELDFMREIYCFDYINADTNEIVGIMNQYIRDTAKIVEEAEKKWGHDIELSVRLMRDLDQCYQFGFDPITWNEEKLVDSITVTPRFSSNDSAMPIADWKARLNGVEIFAGVETLVNTNVKGCCASAEVVRGYGAQYLTAGADGLYLFNYMTSPPGVGVREKEVYDTCGSLDEILKHSRRHVVTYQDTAPKGYEPYKPLPLKIKAGRDAVLEIETGYIPNGAHVSIYVGLNKETDENSFSLSVNDAQCSAPVRDEVYGRSEADGSDIPQGYCSEDCVIYRFDLTDTADLPNLLSLSFRSGSAATIVYAEVKVSE